MRPRLLAAGCLLAALTGAASASPALAGGSGGPVGGPLLTGSHVVERPGPGAPPLPKAKNLPASSWLVADLTTGQVLAAKAPHVRYRPASTLKVLTALTLIPRLHASSLVKITNADEAVGGSMVGFPPGRRYSVHLLFTAMLVVSGNDAATALASADGGVPRTVAEMNAEARHLQADDTHVGTVDGLDAAGQHSSAYDLALIARAALALPSFRRYVATESAYVRYGRRKHFEIQSHNPLLGVYPGTIGVKNGYTTEDDATYIGAATHHGTTILVTLMHANPDFAPMAEALLSWGFAANGRVRPVGTLVAPRGAPGQAHSSRHHDLRPAAAVAAGSVGSVKLSVPEEVGIGLGVLVVLALALGTRARLRRRRRRLSLPRF